MSTAGPEVFMLFALTLALVVSANASGAEASVDASRARDSTVSSDMLMIASVDESEGTPPPAVALARALTPDAKNDASVFAAPQANCMSFCGAFDQVCLGGAISRSVNGCISWGTLGALCGCLGGMLCGLVPGIMFANTVQAVTGGAEGAPDGSGAMLAFALGGGTIGTFLGAGVGGAFGLLTGPFMGEPAPGYDDGYGSPPPSDGGDGGGGARPIRRDRDSSKSDPGHVSKDPKKPSKDRNKKPGSKSPSGSRGDNRSGSGGGDDDRSGSVDDDRSGGSQTPRTENKSRTERKESDKKKTEKKKSEKKKKSDDDDEDDDKKKKKMKRSALDVSDAVLLAQQF